MARCEGVRDGSAALRACPGRQGQPDGGLGIRVAWTRDDGTVATKTLWTDAAGAAWTGPVGKSPFMRQRTVKVAATANLVTTRVLALVLRDAPARGADSGLRTRVSGDTVVAGQAARTWSPRDRHAVPGEPAPGVVDVDGGRHGHRPDERVHRRRGQARSTLPITADRPGERSP